MKQAMRSMSLTLLLACAASAAWAGDRILIAQEGGGSAVLIDQSGNSGENIASVSQSGGNNGGEGQVAAITQVNVNGALASISQAGGNTHSTIIQRDGAGMSAQIITPTASGGSGNRFMIEQSGVDVQAAIVDHGTSASQAMISQMGMGGMNRAEIVLSANEGQFAMIQQSNVNGAQAQIARMGSNSQSSIFQRDGANMTAEITSPPNQGGGIGNTFTIEQSGVDVSARIHDNGAFHSHASIMQSGAGGMNSADIVQSGFNNVASIVQIGSNLNASITQNGQGPSNSVSIIQRQ